MMMLEAKSMNHEMILGTMMSPYEMDVSPSSRLTSRKYDTNWHHHTPAHHTRVVTSACRLLISDDGTFTFFGKKVESLFNRSKDRFVCLIETFTTQPEP